MGDKIKTILSRWRSHPSIANNVVDWRVIAPKSAETSDFPPSISPQLIQSLQSLGIKALYQHQALSYHAISQGHNVAVVSGTASGKTLCYNLPVIDSLIKISEGTALYLFPTKALAQDQLSNLRELINQLNLGGQIQANIYDGDTPQHLRSLQIGRAHV